MEVLELSSKNIIPPIELGQSVRALADSIGTKQGIQSKILQPEQLEKEVEGLFSRVYDADAIMNEPIHRIREKVKITKQPLTTIFLNALDKNSIVFISSIRFGTILTIAAIIAYSADFNRSYWVPLSCAAVMSGPTIIATFHRAIQRTFGTIAGLLIASLILSSVHNGFVIASIILCLTFITELFIVRNYGLAAMFFTPSALIMAEYSSQVYDFGYFASVRITDIVVGSLIGLIGALLVGSRSASSLLHRYIAKTIRSQGQFILRVYSEQNSDIGFEESRVGSTMQTNLVNLLTVYDTALGELFINKTKLESIWPVIFSIEQLGYYLNASLKYAERTVLSEKDLAQLLYVFETMAMAIEQNTHVTDKKIPKIEGFININNEIRDLQEALKLRERILN